METAPRILVIDDDHNVHETLRPWLSREGYVVESAFGGKDGLDAAKRVEPSLIILDVMMPGLDGVSVCLELNRALPTVPVLMLSARDDVMDRVIGLESGADDYVTKPFKIRILI
ncbi:MAG TPA: response regulator transcription factor, partial [Phycisphaerales bacterium]|nr:response regulator transcription factor [Phycisphaerales bacterium]